jgi:tRNA(fMet)-specific endonuclease VapC
VSLWLLDTNTISEIFRNPFGTVAKRIGSTDQSDLCTSIVVACELRFGAAKRGSAKLTAWVEATLNDFDVQPLGADADRHYARLRAELERKGTPISSNDMLIAAHALALDATLVSANTREFARIEGLKLENWLE